MTPGAIVHNATGTASVTVASGATVSLGGGDEQSLGKLYDLSDVVLLAQTQAFQMCLARMSGEISSDKYIDQLRSIRDNARDLVLAQTGGETVSWLFVYKQLIDEQIWCEQDVVLEAADTATKIREDSSLDAATKTQRLDQLALDKTKNLEICELYGTAATKALAAGPSSKESATKSTGAAQQSDSATTPATSAGTTPGTSGSSATPAIGAGSGLGSGKGPGK